MSATRALYPVGVLVWTPTGRVTGPDRKGVRLGRCQVGSGEFPNPSKVEKEGSAAGVAAGQAGCGFWGFGDCGLWIVDCMEPVWDVVVGRWLQLCGCRRAGAWRRAPKSLRLFLGRMCGSRPTRTRRRRDAQWTKRLTARIETAHGPNGTSRQPAGQCLAVAWQLALAGDSRPTVILPAPVPVPLQQVPPQSRCRSPPVRLQRAPCHLLGSSFRALCQCPASALWGGQEHCFGALVPRKGGQHGHWATSSLSQCPQQMESKATKQPSPGFS